MVFDILIDGESNGGLVEGAARVIFYLLDPLLVKVLRGFELLTQSVDLRKLGIKLLLLHVEFLQVILVDL